MQPDTETIQKNKDDLSYFTLSNFYYLKILLEKRQLKKRSKDLAVVR